MDRLIEAHLKAGEGGRPGGIGGDVHPDVTHDAVGSPAGPLHGPEAARGFYQMLTRNITTEQMDVTHAWYGDNFCTIEHQWRGRRAWRIPRDPRARTADLLPHTAHL
jgi:uncharacterized protein